MGKRKSKGIRELDKYQIDSGKLTLSQAVKAMHADCMGRCTDGRLDCKMPECPLYPFLYFLSLIKTSLQRKEKN